MVVIYRFARTITETSEFCGSYLEYIIAMRPIHPVPAHQSFLFYDDIHIDGFGTVAGREYALKFLRYFGLIYLSVFVENPVFSDILQTVRNFSVDVRKDAKFIGKFCKSVNAAGNRRSAIGVKNSDFPL